MMVCSWNLELASYSPLSSLHMQVEKQQCILGEHVQHQSMQVGKITSQPHEVNAVVRLLNLRRNASNNWDQLKYHWHMKPDAPLPVNSSMYIAPSRLQRPHVRLSIHKTHVSQGCQLQMQGRGTVSAHGTSKER
jgi:hypothetical protein